MNNETSLRHRMKEARDVRGWTLAQAANMMGVTSETLRAWESGKTVPRVNRLLTTAGVLGVSLKWLMTGDEDLDPGLDSRSRLDMIASQLDHAMTASSALQAKLKHLSTEIAAARQINDHLDTLAES